MFSVGIVSLVLVYILYLNDNASLVHHQEKEMPPMGTQGTDLLGVNQKQKIANRRVLSIMCVPLDVVLVIAAITGGSSSLNMLG
jgi:hypothetical protein